MLTLNVLPLNLLPLNAIKLISEYSKPVTRPDWRTFKRQIDTRYFIQCLEKYNELSVFQLVKNNMVTSHFYVAYHHIYYYGITSYITLYREDKNVVLSNKLLDARNESYKNYLFMHFYGLKKYR